MNRLSGNTHQVGDVSQASGVCLSVAFYYAILFIERRTLTRLGMQTVE